jgi:hypothetical protein
VVRNVDPVPRQQIRFCATPAGVRVAYATAGRGPALVVPAAWLGHLALDRLDLLGISMAALSPKFGLACDAEQIARIAGVPHRGPS